MLAQVYCPGVLDGVGIRIKGKKGLRGDVEVAEAEPNTGSTDLVAPNLLGYVVKGLYYP